MPHIGKRIIKSAIGVWACYLVHLLRGGEGIVFYSQLAVLWCIQPYVKDSLKNGLQRTIGTGIGAFYGILVILVSNGLFPEFFLHEGSYALLVSLGIVAVLYTTVVLKQKNASYFSTVVFLSIVVIHIRDVSPLLFVWNRVLDTMIGIVLGVGINMFQIPRRKRKDILFLSGVDETLLSGRAGISDYSRVEINRMLEDGAHFTVSTMRTPASVIDVLGGIRWKLPLIVMDGAALFDMKERCYLKTYPLCRGRVDEIKAFFRRMGKNCFINTVIDGMLVICYQELATEGERKLVGDLRKSPYRNLVKRDLSEDGEVLYFMVFGEKVVMDSVYGELQKEPYFSTLKVLYYPSTDYPGNMYLKLYDRKATRENMMEYLKVYLGLEKTITFGSIEGKYDVVVHRKERDIVAHTLERVYEPYFFERNRK